MTLAAWLIMAGSVIVVGLVFNRIAGLHTIETRDAIDSFLSEPPGSDLGVGVDGVVTLIRICAMVAAGCATAAGVLGYHVLRRSRSARLALTVLAAPLFVAGMVTGGFVSSVVAAASVMLWLQPSRDWFDGVTRTRPQPEARPATSAPAAAAAAPIVWPAEHVAGSPSRPSAVVWACVLTWVCSGLTALAMVASAIALAIEPDQLIDRAREQSPELSQQGVTDGMLLALTYVMMGGIVLWALSSIVLGVLTYRRVEWARIVLVISAATAAALCLIGTMVGSFLLVVPMIASVFTIVLLVRADTRPWFQRRRDLPPAL